MMKKLLVRVGVALIGLFVLMLTGVPFQLSSSDSMISALAMGRRPPIQPNPIPGPPTRPVPVPEPMTLALLGAGVAGVGAYFIIKKKGRK